MSFQDRRYWEAVFKRFPDAVAFMADPLPSYVGKINDRRNNELRQVLEPFVNLVAEFGMTMIGITHMGKATDGRTAVNKILDSVAYANLARATHFVSRDPDNPKRRLFMPGPCNYADADTPAIAFTIVERTILDDAGNPMAIAVPEFDPVPVQVNPDDVVGRQVRRSKPGPPAVEAGKLAKFVLDLLRRDGVTLLAKIADEAGAAGFLGKQTVDADGRTKWSGFTALYRAVDAVPGLPSPDDGWVIVTSREDSSLRNANGKARWMAKTSDVPF